MGKYRNKNWITCDHNYQRSYGCIEQHVKEILVVVKSNAVADPWTMMIHFEDALTALRAVMGSIRLSS